MIFRYIQGKKIKTMIFMLDSHIGIFCAVDDFCKSFEDESGQLLLTDTKNKLKSRCRMALSEIMTIVILFHISGYRTFKYFYKECILGTLKGDFRTLSYNRFVEVMEYALMPLTIFLYGIKGKDTGVNYVDSTTLKVCHSKREKSNKVFDGFAAKGKNSMGWFFGLKLHMVINNEGEIMSCAITPGNVDDRVPVAKLMKNLQGWLFADKGYLGTPIIEKLKKQAVDIFTKVRKTMKKRFFTKAQEYLLNKRGIVETVIGLLKEYCHIEHTRHRKPANAFVNIISGLIAYAFRERKPSVSIDCICSAEKLIASN